MTSGRITRVLLSLVMGISMGLLTASDAEAQTIGLGGVGSYYFGWDQNTNANGSIIPQAFSSSGVYHRVAGNNESVAVDTTGVPGEIVFHFQSDPGTQIETASVESDIRIWFPTAMARGSWSPDNSSWTEFVAVTNPGITDMNFDLIPLADTGWAPSRDLYLKYELTGNLGYANVFLSDGRFAKDTFVVEGTISVLRIVDFTQVSLEDTVAMQFLSLSGTVYTLEYTTDLVQSSEWFNAGSSLSGSGTNMFFFDPHEHSGSSTSKAYRILMP